MARRNIEILSDYYSALNRREVSALEMLAPAFEFHPAGLFPDLEEVYVGRDQYLQFLERFVEPWAELSIEADAFLDLGDRTLVMLRFDARGRDSIAVELRLFHLWTMEGGQALRLDAYTEEAALLKASGLSSEQLQSARETA